MKWMDGRMHLLHLKYLGGSLAGPLDPLIEGSHFYISKNLMPKCISTRVERSMALHKFRFCGSHYSYSFPLKTRFS